MSSVMVTFPDIIAGSGVPSEKCSGNREIFNVRVTLAIMSIE